MHTQPPENTVYCVRCRHELISTADNWEDLVCSDCIDEESFELVEKHITPQPTKSQELSSFGARWNRVGGPEDFVLRPGRHLIP